VSYPYRAARYQYGPRKGTLGLALHHSEGGDELVDYLAGNPARGVSANFALLQTGVMWQMTPLSTASGSLNPADRSTDKGYYGHSTLVAVLGDHWPDPNTWCISLEIAGHAATGPNPRQVEAIVKWAADMKVVFPTLRGAFGHADQTDTKGCPGTTPAMKSVFERIGGHGLWKGDMPGLKLTLPSPAVAGTVTFAKGIEALRVYDGARYVVPLANTSGRPATKATHVGGSAGYLVDLNGDDVHFIREGDAVFSPAALAPDPAAVKAAVTAALDHVAPTLRAAETALNEARPR
jgi:hypothetical protein